MDQRTCQAPGCTNPPRRATGEICNAHRWRLKNWGHYGDPGPPGKATTVPVGQRYEVQPNGCWQWTGKTTRGYGTANIDGSSVRVHRYFYEQSGRLLPEGMYLDHICRNRTCVNPEHLRPVTAKQNAENRSLAGYGFSGIRGVYFNKSGRWEARAVHRGKAHIAGYYETKEEAAEAVVALRNSLHTHNDTDRQAS